MFGEGRGHLARGWWGNELNVVTSLSWSELRLRGADAISFAQGQFSQDVTSQRKPSLLLAPDGHVVAGGELWAEGDEVVFSVPTLLIDASVARLRRFVLRVDVAISHHEDTRGRFLKVEDLFDAYWPSEFEWTLGLPPHSYGQWVVDESVSFQKGCFTGQELVGRADARGATMPWRFVGGRARDIQAVDAALRAVGPVGPQGVTSYAKIDEVLCWRGFAHRTWVCDDARVTVDFMA